MSVQQHINDLLTKHDAALNTKDMSTLAQCFTDDARIMDIKAIVVGGTAMVELWEQCFPYFEKPLVIHRKDIQDVITDHMVVRSYLSRVSGMEGEENMPELWLRGTTCFIKTDAYPDCGGFQICHEHASFAVEVCQSGMTVVGA